MKRNFSEAGMGTKSLWAGEDDSLAKGATQVPIVQSIAFTYDDVDDWLDVALGKKEGHIYSRTTNPTFAAFEEKVRILEGAEAATSFASGMGAISNTIFGLVLPGERIVTIKDTYGGTNQLFREFLPKLKMDVALCDTADGDQIEKEIRMGCKMVYLETPTNPTLKVVDIKRAAEAAHKVGAIVVTDNTFATPVNQETYRARVGPGRPQRLEVLGRPRGRPGRHRLRPKGPHQEDIPLQGNHRCSPGPLRRLPSHPWHEDAPAEGRATECERHEDSSTPGRQVGSDNRQLSRP